MCLDGCFELKWTLAGVPKSGILGPLLYILHTNSIPILEEATIATFADDTAIMAEGYTVVGSNQRTIKCNRQDL